MDHGEPPLCTTCRFATIVKGRTLREEVGFCSQMPREDRRIRFPVTCCTSYLDTRQPSLWHMEEIAWVPRSSPGRKSIGFVEASRLKDEKKHVLED